ncbi:glyoxalase [bacterium]|nr:glyoxalase [bacterium]
MKYLGTLLAVKDIEKAKKFYCDIFELTVVSDFGANVSLSCGISFQTIASWKNLIGKEEEEIILKNNAIEVYFEVEDLDAFSQKIALYPNIEYVHKMVEQPWGQRAIRFYDMDKHIIEVGEDMSVVVKRFLKSGLNEEQTAKRMGVPIECVNYFKNLCN